MDLFFLGGVEGMGTCLLSNWTGGGHLALSLKGGLIRVHYQVNYEIWI